SSWSSPTTLGVFSWSRDPPPLPPFPTRRSSDLGRGSAVAARPASAAARRAAAAATARAAGGGWRPARGCGAAGPGSAWAGRRARSEEHTSELQSHLNLVCRLLLDSKSNSSLVCL